MIYYFQCTIISISFSLNCSSNGILSDSAFVFCWFILRVKPVTSFDKIPKFEFKIVPGQRDVCVFFV